MLGCASKPLMLSKTDNDITFGDLIKIDNSKMDLSYVKQSFNWHKYNAIHIAKITADNNHSDNYKPPKKEKWDGYNATFDIQESGLKKLEAEFISMAKNTFDDKQIWQYKDSVDENTLVLYIEIPDIRLSAPLESSRINQNINGRSYTQNAGSMVLKAIILDGESNEVIATSIDRATAHDNWRLNTQVFNWSDVRTIFQSWANALKNAIFQIYLKHQEYHFHLGTFMINNNKTQ